MSKFKTMVRKDIELCDEYIGKNIFTVQFHPEACPGPQDSAYLFDRFITMMGGDK